MSKKFLSLTVIMITYNEEHNMEKVLKNLKGWAKEVIVLDSYSTDKTLNIARKFKAKIFKRKFKNFSDQWNFAVKNLPINTKWVMKIDPDEIISKQLKKNIEIELKNNEYNGFYLNRYLFFMGSKINVKQKILRIWEKGNCKFSNSLVNEYPIVKGNLKMIDGILEHHDSPDLFHWFNKQNLYSSLDALAYGKKEYLAFKPKLLGNSLERRMWLKKNFKYFPFRYLLLFFYNWIILGSWRSGEKGYAWSKLRSFYYYAVYLKQKELYLNIVNKKEIKKNIVKWRKF
tara:strand:+ start:233 stop:1090 length:858 start_codon:yes stop_codon:yes gene_type:complete